VADLETLSINGINLEEVSDPSTPASGRLRLYGKTTGLFYITDGGSVVGPLAPASGAAALQSGRVVKSGGNFTTSATTFTDVTGFSITITTGARRCLVTFTGSIACNNVAGGIGLTVDIDGVNQGGASGGLMFFGTPAANEHHNGSFSYLTDTLTAASHTFKLQMLGSNAAHTNTLHGADPVSVFSVVELYA
jgi:hypothetical protein